MNRGTMRDWKLGRLFLLVATEHPDVTMGTDSENLIFYGATRTAKVNVEMVEDARNVESVAAVVSQALRP